jgi:hypothetical protein
MVMKDEIDETVMKEHGCIDPAVGRPFGIFSGG